MFCSARLLTLGLVACVGAGAAQDATTNQVWPTNGRPLVINTWGFINATRAAWKVLKSGKSALDALEVGCTTCEEEQCDGTVGYGGSPDENGETTLDAMVFNGDTMEMGAVAGLRRIKQAASVARKVMEHTGHSILAGDLATQFAKQMGFEEQALSTNASLSSWKEWKEGNCQPNFWKDVKPNPQDNCGPYHANRNLMFDEKLTRKFDRYNHDTISMVVIDSKGSVVAGTSSNGAKFKIPGRIGDAPLPGAGAYADSKIGAAVATGDGDVMMRFLPSSTIVHLMKNGVHPHQAAKRLVNQIAKYYPNFSGALIAVSKNGNFGAACHGIPSFPFSVAHGNSVRIHKIECTP